MIVQLPRVLSLIFLFGFVFAQITDTPPFLYQSQNTVYQNEFVSLSNYNNVILTNNTIVNSTFYISNVLSLQISGTITIDHPQAALFYLVNVKAFSHFNNTHTASTQPSFELGIVNAVPSTCVSWKRIIDIEINNNASPSMSPPSIYIHDNQLYASSLQRPESLVMMNYQSLGSEKLTVLLSNLTLDYYRNQIIYNDSSLYINGTNVLDHTCQYPYPTRITIGATNLHRSGAFFNLNNFTGASVFLNLNSMEFRCPNCTNSPGPSASNLHLWDSIVALKGLYQTSNGTITEDSQIVISPSLRPPVRIKMSILGTPVATVIAIFKLASYPTGYQYVSSQFLAFLYTSPQNVSAYTHDIQIEPDPTDQFGGWNECHYTARYGRSSCLLSDPVLGEFSVNYDGVCYGVAFHDQLITASTKCGFPQLQITPPYENSETTIWTSDNRINGSLLVTPRSGYSGTVNLYMNDSLLVSDYYKSIYDSARFAANPLDSYFTGSHPFLIIPKITLSQPVALTSLLFQGIQFIPQADASNRALFSNMIYDPSNTFSNLSQIPFATFGFDQCKFAASFGSSTTFASGTYILNQDSTQTNYVRLFTAITNMYITNSALSYIDVVVSSIQNVMDFGESFIMSNLLTDHSENGLTYHPYISAPQIILQNINSTNSYRNGISQAFIYISGNGTNRAQISNINFTPLSYIGADLTTTTRFLQVQNIADLSLASDISPAILGVGLYFSNITSKICNATTRVQLKIENPTLLGSVYDFMCSIGQTTYYEGCLGLGCFQDPALIQPFCIVDPSYPSSGSLYLLQYFPTIQQAINYCNTFPPNRYIYVVRGVYPEVLTIANKFTPENLYLLVYGNLTGFGNVIVNGGAGHSIVPSSAKALNLTIGDGFDIINPSGLVTYTTTTDSYLMQVPSISTLNNINIGKARFIGYQPSEPFASVPSSTNFTGWQALITELLSNNSLMEPSIRSPNTAVLLSISLDGSSYLENTKFYGSYTQGYKESRASSSTGSTMLINVDGENQWNYHIYLTNAYNTTRIMNQCSSFCGGLTSQFSTPSAVVFISFSPNAVYYYEYMNDISLGPAAVGNSYVKSRDPYGNPYYATPGGYFIGYLTALWLQGASGPTWQFFKIRYNTYRNLPQCVRLDTMDPVVLALNNDYIYANDSQSVPRQIQLMNNPSDPTGYISCTTNDIKIGTTSMDRFVGLNNEYVCNQMWPPPASSTVCFVSATYVSLDSTHFNTITDAIRNCPTTSIYVKDSLFAENITTDFTFIKSRPGGTWLSIIGFGTIVLEGNHNFFHTCATNVPTANITFTNINFYSLGGAPLINITATPGCNVMNKILFTSSTFYSADQTQNGIQCIDCAFQSILINSATFSGKYATTLLMEGNDYTAFNVTNSDFSAATAFVNAIDIVNANGINAQSLTGIICTNYLGIDMNAGILGCVQVVGSDASPFFIIKALSVQSNMATATLQNITFDGIVWMTLSTLTLDQVGALTTQIVANSGAASRFGTNIIVDNIDSAYPCIPGTDATIVSIGTNNSITGLSEADVITDPTGAVVTLINTRANLLYCLVFNKLLLQTSNIQTILIIYVGLGFLFAFLVYITFCGGCETLCAVKDSQIEADPNLVHALSVKRAAASSSKVVTNG